MIKHCIFVLPVFLLLLSGCVSEQQQIQMDKQKCLNFGYTNSNKLADCVKDIQIQRDKESNYNFRQNNRWMHTQSSKSK
ncbi:hypothetical protein GCM10027155_17160 [Acinetobacter apis]|uniref:Lipoprotein n=1 Tax=Acinetobacter apis TaxID=1229165 RepID=A0A217EGD3_9GAMM|nr:hypothetical protein [Acinetobacter apis]SNQ29545.1 hypothetical protein SAMN05444584_1503 [Acinetobacter apis]